MITIEFLKSLNITYKEIEYSDDITIYKLNNSHNLVVCLSKDSTFKIERDLFFYLDNQSIGYSFLLINISDEKYFFLEYNKISRWIKSSFESCEKDVIYFGKIVLQNRISINELTNKIGKIAK